MSILPTNERKPTVDTPHNFFIYGATMSGKSYLAERFPNPLFINTDGNSLANPAPSIQLRNVKDENGNLKQSVLEDLDEIMFELQTQNKNKQFGYETIVLDVIDDICQLIEQAICTEAGVKSLSDIGYGKGYATFNTVLQDLVMNLKSLPLNIVYISRVNYETKDGVDTAKEVPSLKTKYYNVVNGNCDLVIHTQKVGTNYIRTIKDKRKKYYEDKINDPKILRILKAIPGAISKRPIEKKTDSK